MKLQLEPVFNTEGSRLPFDFSLDLSGLTVSGQTPIQKPAKVTGSVQNKAGLVTLTGEISLTYEAACDRCAAPTVTQYRFPMAHTLVRELNDEENGDFLLLENAELALDVLAEEDVNLALPTKYLCKEDCKGLCPICGQDLNQNQCDCKKPIDPRLQGLLQFLDE